MPLPVPALPAAPADVTVEINAAGNLVTLRVARNWSAETGLVVSVVPLAATGLPTTGGVTPGPTSATVQFAAPADGVYAVTVSAASGTLLRMGVAAVGRTTRTLRQLNRPLATSGRGGQATGADDDEAWAPWRALRARLRLLLACCATADYPTAQALADSLPPPADLA